MSEKLRLTGVILAGGKSSRMGRNKALLPFEGRPVLEHLAGIFDSVFEQSLIIVDDRMKYRHLDLPPAFFYEDLLKDRGPLGGLSTGLAYAAYPACFVATCDMPLINEAFIRQMAAAWKGDPCDALCIKNPNGEWEPFPGIYVRENKPLIRILLDLGHLSMRRLFEVISVDCWEMPEELRGRMVNMNTPREYEELLERRLK